MGPSPSYNPRLKTMTQEVDINRVISASLLRIRMRAPFFATLALFARVVPTDEVETAATDGRSVFINPAFFATLTPRQHDEVLLHKVLHAALLHVPRRGSRDRQLWNAACDVVINGMIAGVAGMELHTGATRDPAREHLSVEEVYELLQHDPHQPALVTIDMIDRIPQDEAAPGGSDQDSVAAARSDQLQAYWRDAHQHANLIAFAVAQGHAAAGLARELGMLAPARLDWRTHLWRYLVQTPSDFQGFDRRFIGRGLYLDALEGESIRVYVAIDTSGSVDDRQIRALAAEVQGILAAYPHVVCDLYYCDAQCHGPFRLSARGEIPQPIGGGGTDFRPFFEAVERDHNPHQSGVCVYLTDGFGDFPAQPPTLPVLWVVTPGGRNFEVFPFGETTRLLTEAG